MKTLWLSAGVLAAIVLISLTLFLKGNETVSPLKCKAFSRATIDVQNGPLVFSTVENLQLYNERKEGMIHYNGYVKSPVANTYLERTIYLSSGVKIDKDTFSYKINRIVAAPLDTTSDDTFDQMWLENTSDNKTITLNIKNIRDGIFTVSSPYSLQYTCVKY
ncbi:FidL-like protein [Enterobacter cloacae subsp. cloacae]|jgi:hypothetical protein|uniref:FidL-like protein n=1 Tax=Enterobacter cloacae TaxID=550 RepID=UPI00197CE7C2|nr:FidL-like protein [Enterobacter cloacae]EMC0025826.1 hypothetical protein [Enterobacter cloacae]MBN4760377.1 hypothetical protein [Enterobacter cloacae]MCT2764279.1 hypothetical protein [Enterobacter cloacae]MCU6311977.1 hypothetical protein [Enterobacter cloacae]MDR1749691.1 FidL-like protein [Enterobacter cloacae]